MVSLWLRHEWCIYNQHRLIIYAVSMLDLQRNVVFTTPHIIGHNMNEYVLFNSDVKIDSNIYRPKILLYYNYDWWWRMQTEVQRRIEEEVEVERQVSQRIEAQGKYMESMLVKACETQEASLTKDYSTLFFAPNTICNNTSPLTIQWFEDQFPSSSSMDSAMHLPDINSNFSLQDSRSSITKNHTVCLG